MTRQEALAVAPGTTVWFLEDGRRRFSRLVELGTVEWAVVENGGGDFPVERKEVRLTDLHVYRKPVPVTTTTRVKRGR